MQTSGVATGSCITDVAASNVFDALRLGITVAFCSGHLRRCLCAGEQALDRAVMDRPDPALACVWHGEEVRLRVERLDADAASGAVRRADVPSLQHVPGMDRGSREPAHSDNQGHGLNVGPVR